MTRLLTLLLLLVMATGGLLLAMRPVAEMALVDYFPEDTLIFIEKNHAASAPGQGLLDQVARTFAPTVWRQLTPLVAGNETLLAEARRLAAAGEALLNRPVVSSLLEHGTAFALLPEGAGQSDFVPSRQWLVAVPVDDQVSAQGFEHLFGHIRSRQTLGYQGEVLVRLAVDDGQDFLYWRHGKVALVACEQALLQRCIDRNLQRLTRDVAALSTNSAYARLHRISQDRADIFCWLDLDGLSQRTPLVREIDDASGGLLPRTLAFSTHAASETSRTMRVGALVGREAASAFVARRHLPPPVPHPLIEPMPQQTKLALWTNWFDLKDLWDWLRQQAGDEVAALMTSIGQQASEATGKSLDDFFDVFGGEFGVMITGQPVAHQAPRLLGGLVVTVRDRPAAAAMIARMVAGLQVITVKASDLDISSVLLVGGLLQPAYALLERHLILADNAELVEAVRRQLLHGDGTDGGATGEPDLARRQGNVAVFLRVGEMIERLTPLLTLAGREMDERNRMASPEAYRLMREIGPPVLAALRNLATARFHGALAEDILFMELEYTLQRD